MPREPMEPRPRRRASSQWIGFGILLLLVLVGLGIWSITRSPGDPQTADAQGSPSRAEPVDPVVTTASTAAPTTTTTRAVAMPVTVATSPLPAQGVVSGVPASADVHFPNCTAARAAGYAPIHFYEPGYRLALDGDKDGVACE